MSPRDHYHDNPGLESCAHILKHKRIRRTPYITRDAVNQDGFDYLGLFYIPTQKHANDGMMSLVDYEMKQQKMNKAGV